MRSLAPVCSHSLARVHCAARAKQSCNRPLVMRAAPRAQDPPVVNLIAMREPKETREAEVRRADLAAELQRRLTALGPLGLLTPPRGAAGPS